MTGRRPILTFALLALAAPAADGGVFNRKPKAEAQKARQLAETLRSDPDEARRRMAVAELAEYDPKVDAAVLSALAGALQRDASESVRAAAAGILGEIKPYSVQGGLALERAAGTDRAGRVREVAREGLWAYHLNGYRSQALTDLVTFQTPEPPLARFGAIRPAAAVSVPSVVLNPNPVRAVAVAPRPPAATPFPLPFGLPPVAMPPGPFAAPRPAGPKAPVALLARPTFPLNRTAEPPLARPSLRGPDASVPASARPSDATFIALPGPAWPTPMGR